MNFKTLDNDRHYLENKFHNTSEPFNGYQRRNYIAYEYDETTGLDVNALTEGLSNLWETLQPLSRPVIKAKMVEYILQNVRIDVNECDYFVGFQSWGRLIGKYIEIWKNEVLASTGKYNELMNLFNSTSAVRMWPDFDHVVPDFDALLSLGFKGILERAKNYRKDRETTLGLTDEQAAYFDSIEITYTAIIDIIDRFYKYALTKKHAKAEKIATCLKNLRDGAPSNIYEAMQLIYIYFIISDGIECYQVRSLGHGLDNSLYPFYLKDLESGTFTRDEIRELLGYFLMQWSAIGNVMGQPMYLGGTNEDGSTKYNELSHDILDVYNHLGIFDPKIQVKVNKNTPKEITDKIFNMIRKGQTSFVFCCEPGMMRAVMSYGATYKEALEMDIRGCYEPGVRANEVATAGSYVNCLKAVEYVFSNGFDKLKNVQVGPKTGDITTFETFEDFYAAVLKQWEYLVDSAIEITNSYEGRLKDINPSPMYSATVTESLEKARDGYQDAMKFNNSVILGCGLGTTFDAVMAVKYLVFDKKETTLKELKAALDNNWEGYELLRAKALACPRKYGNDDNETDIYAESMATWFANKVNGRPNARGGIYKSTTHPAMMFKWQGEKTAATPDGRKSGDEFSKNASPTIAMDKQGVTAMMKSALKLKPYQFLEDFCIDIMLHPSAVSGDEGLAVMHALLNTYIGGGGMAMQFNIFSSLDLRDAQKHPEKYKNLQVRVCGWNNLWNDLTAQEQEAYIQRAEALS